MELELIVRQWKKYFKKLLNVEVSQNSIESTTTQKVKSTLNEETQEKKTDSNNINN